MIINRNSGAEMRFMYLAFPYYDGNIYWFYAGVFLSFYKERTRPEYVEDSS